MEASSEFDRRSSPDSPPGDLRRVLAGVGLDFPRERRLPQPARWAVALAVSLVGSVAADALLVAAGTALFPST
ncbi:MAG: hypothetical protein ACRDY1_01775, partial [Acidimicrobiales bacterium]